MQYLFINNRPVRDRFLMGAIKAAYQDFLAHNRYPVFALFLDVPLDEVDVNVHPAKTEVRFRDNQKIRALIIKSVKSAISSAGHRASTTVASSTINAFKTEPRNNYHPLSDSASQQSFESAPKQHSGYSSYSNHSAPRFTKADQISSDLLLQAPPHAPAARMDGVEQVNNQPTEHNNFPLGVARCQLHETYIVAQTENSIILVDQHAAHERLLYEKMKEQMAETGVTRQTLLIPELIELPSEQLEIILSKAEELFNIGIIIEAFGENQIIVRETPALFGDINVSDLIKDLANDLIEYGDLLTAKDKFTDICGTIACHSSIRAGRKLNILEMNQILRDMEKTPHSGQCNHGRPTYVELELKDIEKLFGRS
jgi:DNA mismatch repair protein MutL